MDTYVDNNRETLFPVPLDPASDLNDVQVRTIRERIFKENLLRQKYSRDRLASSGGGIQQLANQGVINGQWVGGLMCDKAASVLGLAKEYRNEKGGNHNIIELGGGRWIDPTWKQFFRPPGNPATRGKPPIFEGNADAFRAMGLDKARTEAYLALIHKEKQAQP
ncbi:hypothetical protein [Ensifer sp. SL37]|uniref:hypothetical protein n=1 Tax=Ensifer sp. SL37 TaxID=2995137 RepID=UPI002275C6FE|nr:hypothetical protein [Ensifer sp. SL37]MCY1740563.1 hypothetical protein [Ensifer sp. SL37]